MAVRSRRICRMFRRSCFTAAFVLLALALATALRSWPRQATAAAPGAPTIAETSIASHPIAAHGGEPEGWGELRALWVDAFHDGIKTPEQADQLLAWARQAGFNALFVQVRRRGDAYFNRALEPRTEDPNLTPGFDALQYLIDGAHRGTPRLQIHAWIATLAVWNQRDAAPLDARHVVNAHGLDATEPDTWLMLRDDGEAWAGGAVAGTYYVDPGHPDAARYTATVALDILRRYDVDGVQLDQVRYFEGAGFDRRWGYNPTSVARFNRATGRDADTVPAPTDPAWMEWRRAQVTALVRRVYLETKAVKPHVAVSAAVVTWGAGPEKAGGWQRTAPYDGAFQDWKSWLQQGIVDFVVPMDYFRDRTSSLAFDSWTSWQQSHAGIRGVVVGIGAYLNQPEETVAQVARARASGPLGVALYSYATPTRDRALPSAEGRERLASALRAVFTAPARPRLLPWIARPSRGNLAIDIPGHEGAVVVVSGPEQEEWRTDGTGLAGAADLAPGRYTVSVRAEDVEAAPAEVSVNAGETTLVRYLPGQAAP